jgi:hypothetical protein
MAMSLTKEQRWKVGGGATVVLIVLIPLWEGMRVRGAPIWNAFLFVFLAALFVGTIYLHRMLLKNVDQVGEARFDTRNK